jgi:hypothetical protein
VATSEGVGNCETNHVVGSAPALLSEPRRAATMFFNPSAVMLNPQPLPPRVLYGRILPYVSPLSLVALNPQPLPPGELGGIIIVGG